MEKRLDAESWGLELVGYRKYGVERKHVNTKLFRQEAQYKNNILN
jgi:hypothetical protein